MNNMRIKSHRPQVSPAKMPKTERFTRYTPLGAIRLVPPLPAESTAPAPTPVANKISNADVKTGRKNPKKK